MTERGSQLYNGCGLFLGRGGSRRRFRNCFGQKVLPSVCATHPKANIASVVACTDMPARALATFSTSSSRLLRTRIMRSRPLLHKPNTFFFCHKILALTFQLNSWEVLPSANFWTSRGHRCRVVPSPPGTCLQFISRTEFSIPTIARRFSSNAANSRSRLSANRFIIYARKSPYEYVHSVIIIGTYLVLINTVHTLSLIHI